ncbi:LLM class flavin-dependent oxidoreductase [Pseudochelatococcus sp. B33]
MSIEFIGMIQPKLSSEIYPSDATVIDLDYVRRSAVAHDESGFDRILVGYYSNGPDGFLLGQLAASHTKKAGVLIAHRPGFAAPPVIARKFATLDHITRGRVALHVITGGSDADQRRDGDWLPKADRYRRTDEYIGVLKRIWSEDAPVHHQGEFYHLEGASVVPAPYQRNIPIYFGGASHDAIAVAGRHADVFALWGETLDQARELIGRVREAAALHHRQVRFSVSLRPILAETEDAAWARAQEFLARAKAIRKAAGLDPSPRAPEAEGSRRLLEAATKGTRLDKRLWTEMAAITGASGNTTALVGTPDQVADALLDYYDIGITTFLIRGFDPLEDAIEYGRELLPRVRALIGKRGVSGGPAPTMRSSDIPDGR